MPLDLFLNHVGDGRFECRYPDQRQLCNEKLQPNARVKAKVTRPRSTPHHNFFFKKIERLWDNLLETDDRFPTPERLRKHLLVCAGHCDRMKVPLDQVETMLPLFKALRGFDDELFFFPSRDGVEVRKAKSIAHTMVDQDQFNELDGRVNAVIAKQFQINPDDLMESAVKDAA